METKRIFNIQQANLFISQGCRVAGVGLGRKSKVYLSFVIDETFKDMMKKWDNNAFTK